MTTDPQGFIHHESRRRILPRGGAALSAALILFAACQTETPHEIFGARAASGTSGGSGNSNGSGGSGARNPSGGSGNSDGSGASGNAAGEGGSHDGAGGDGSGPEKPSDFDCGEPPVSTKAFTRANFRAAAAECAMWQYCRFEGAALALNENVRAHAAERSKASLAEAQAAWRQAMAVWSNVELFQFGPLGTKVESQGKDPVHGQGIRDLIYSWPVVARCRVEEQVIGRGYEQSWTPVPISARGLFGIEYLLFYPGADTGCNANSTTAKTWDTLSEDELTDAKLDYAVALADDVLARIQTLRELWSPEGGNFRQTFIDAAGYETEQQALNVLAWSLIYAEREVKDWKVGIPAGYTMTAPVTLPETPFAHFGAESLRQNLEGFRALFQGCGPNGEGLGFDDWLSDAGAPDLAADMVQALDNARDAAAKFPGFEQATPADLEALYQAVKALTNLLKSDFFGTGSVLNLKLPEGVASDTD
jgi:predicted lipoprotein